MIHNFRWYFDMSTRACRGFSYSGCGGNHNRFPNSQMCNAVCGAAIEFLTPKDE